MKARAIIDAIADGERDIMRQGFCALVDLREERVQATSPGLLVAALNRLIVALVEDAAMMPPETCAALGLPVGATYAEGAAKARRDAASLARQLMAPVEALQA